LCGERIKKEQSRSDKKLEKERREKKGRKNDKSEGGKRRKDKFLAYSIIILLLCYFI